MIWYSSCLRFACLIEPEGLTRYMDNVYIIRANNYESAFEKLLKIGYKNEEEYLNGENQKVRWTFKEIISIDELGSSIRDQQEIYSQPVDIEPMVSEEFNKKYFPEKSQPTETIGN